MDQKQANQNNASSSSLMYLFLMLFAAITFLAACGLSNNDDEHIHHVGTEIWETTQSKDTAPQFLEAQTDLTQQLYASVHDHKHTLSELPCYCGCMVATEIDEAHDSLMRCYIVDTNDDGSVTWTNHSTSCGICKQELETVIQLSNEGKSLEEIKKAIDEQYKHYH